MSFLLRSSSVTAVALLTALVAAACVASREDDAGDRDTTAPALVTFAPFDTSDPLAVFGWSGLEEAARPLDAREREYGGGMLGNIAGIALGADGAVHVLDRAWMKVALFEPDGRFRGLLGGGAGEGPGELGRPRELRMDADGTVGILDEVPRRIVRVTASGEVLSPIPLDARLAVDFTFADGGVWVLYSARRLGEPAIFFHDGVSGEVRERLGAVDATTLEWMEHGETGALGLLGGALLWALPRTGLLRRIGAGHDAVQGRVLFPDLEPQVETLPSGIPLHWVGEGVNAITVSNDSVVIVHRRTQRQRPPNTGFDTVYLMTILDRELGSPRYFTFGERAPWGGRLTIGRDGRFLYIAFDQPYPRIEKHPLPGG